MSSYETASGVAKQKPQKLRRPVLFTEASMGACNPPSHVLSSHPRVSTLEAVLVRGTSDEGPTGINPIPHNTPSIPGGSLG